MKSTLIALALLVPVLPLFSQVTIGLNNPPDPSAAVDIQSTTGGFLYPRLSTVQRNAIVNPATGLTIYNNTTNCIQVYFPTSGWQDLRCDCQSFPSSAFTSPNTVVFNVAASFTATTPGMNYSWTFQSGNPSTSTSQNPSVTWTTPGNYIVTLTVADQTGCSSTTTDTITVVNCPSPYQSAISFNYTGAQQTWTVPACVTSIIVDAYGAQGGYSIDQHNGNNTGMGGRVQCTLAVTPGTVLNLNVGQWPGSSQTGGWNGGANGSASDDNGYAYKGGGGGGATDIRVGGTALNNRIIVAGGGGGEGAYNCVTNSGGVGGGLTAGTGLQCEGYAGGGGTQVSGGAGTSQYGNGGPGAAGSLGNGGAASDGGSGGGGGGYYGGGAGSWGAGGGGSSYVTNVGTSGIIHTQGVRTGNGQITINY